MRASLLDFAAVVGSLHELLENQLARTKLTNRIVQEEGWTTERVATWLATKNMLRNAVKLMYPKEGWKMPMFPGARDLPWGFPPTQVSPDNFPSGKPGENIHHQPLAFLSRQFKGMQVKW